MTHAISRLPLHVLPGFDHWGRNWEEVTRSQISVWVWGAEGSGVSRVGEALAELRGAAFEDGADGWSEAACRAWTRLHPGGVLGAHRPPPEGFDSWGLTLKIPSLPDHPECAPAVLKHLAIEEGLELPLPGALLAASCPPNLRAAHNRILRWKLLGQLPDPASPTQHLPLDEDSLAMNLHALERVLLHRALRRAYGNRVETAERLGISRRQLYLLIERHGDPLRNEAPSSEGPKRLLKARKKQNSRES